MDVTDHNVNTSRSDHGYSIATGLRDNRGMTTASNSLGAHLGHRCIVFNNKNVPRQLHKRLGSGNPYARFNLMKRNKIHELTAPLCCVQSKQLAIYGTAGMCYKIPM